MQPSHHRAAMEDFYVYLSSGANVEEFKQNKNTKFTNIFKPELDLRGEYDVGLENVYFKPDIVRVNKADEKYKISVCVYEFDNLDNTIYDGCWDYVPEHDLLGSNLKDFIANFNLDLTRFLVQNKVVDPKSPTKIVKIKGDNRIVFSRIKYLNKKEETASIVVGWMLNIGWKNVLGLENVGLERENVHIHTPTCPFPAKLPQPANWLYIYTDAIEPSSLGGQMVDLLGIVPMNHVQAKNTALTIYKRVRKSQIRDISIKVTNENGDPVHFEDGVELLLVLHFKKAG